MNEAIDFVVTRARPKIKALLRARAFYDIADLITQFKIHIWGIIEFSHGCVMHASDTALARIDQLQKSFVRELRVCDEFVFMTYNFAPLELRRDIGVLGFLHKRVLGECHPAIVSLLPFSTQTYSWRHPKQLETHLDTCIARDRLYWRFFCFFSIGALSRLSICSLNPGDRASTILFSLELTRHSEHAQM